MIKDLIESISEGNSKPFALIHRGSEEEVQLFLGDLVEVESIEEIPLRGDREYDALVLLPYRQIRERGYEYPGTDTTPLTVLQIESHSAISLPHLREHLPASSSEFLDEGFDQEDREYEKKVELVIRDEIGAGNGANFVLSRSRRGVMSNWSSKAALGIYGRLLGRESAAHWTFLIWTGTSALIGASPERHITLASGELCMNPISGTLPYPTRHPLSVGNVLRFIENAKETNELSMVLDEELRMMGQLCPQGGVVSGPFLKKLSALAHTEYFIRGRTNCDVRKVLFETMFAPTVVGGPLESATRVIARRETEPRGYYSGVAALIGTGSDGQPALDSSILIRTAFVDRTGGVRIPVGATLVRDSNPTGEALETRVKADTLIRLLKGEPARQVGLLDHQALEAFEVQRALQNRNAAISSFWFSDPATRSVPQSPLRGRHVLVIDAEDRFTAMAQHLLKALGVVVTIRSSSQVEIRDLSLFDLIILGPGPGDPTDLDCPKIRRMHALASELIEGSVPFFAVCLGHQIVSMGLGLPVKALPVPNQGVQCEVTHGGNAELVGFYNSFAAAWPNSTLNSPRREGDIKVEGFTDGGVTFVHTLTGTGFGSVQFHPASILTKNGLRIMRNALERLLPSEHPGRATSRLQ